MATNCFSVVRGKRARITRLDDCGNPPDYGEANAFVVTDGFVRVAMTAQQESGDSITQKNANGDLCINDRSRDQFTRWMLEIEFCRVIPAALEIMANASLEEDWDGNIVGVRSFEGTNANSFALEVWSGIPGKDCVPGEPRQYGYLLLPFVIPGNIGDITIENGATTFTARNAFTRGAGGWGVGPYDVVPTDETNTAGPLGTAMADDEHHLLRMTTIAPPEAQCAAQSMI